jgi:hypothetical protein
VQEEYLKSREFQKDLDCLIKEEHSFSGILDKVKISRFQLKLAFRYMKIAADLIIKFEQFVFSQMV